MKHAFYLWTIAILISSLWANTSSAQIPPKHSVYDSINIGVVHSGILSKYPLMTWLRKSPAEIGCMLESQLGYKDKVFNCAQKNYVNKGDPCKKTKEYYEGLEIPDNLAPKIHTTFKTVTLAFEHGDLQDLTIEFRDSMTIDQIKQLFDLPSDRSQFPINIMDIWYGENITAPNKPIDPRFTRWLDIVGFEHMGSADVDCK